jgi:hypothetical protein
MSSEIKIDVPVIAYKTWVIGHIVTDDNGNRLIDEERKLNENLKRELGNRYPYSPNNPHIER